LGSAVIIFAKELFYIFIDKLYFASNKVVFAGVISAFLYGIFNIVNVHFYSHKRAKNITLAVLIGAGLNIVLNYFLIPLFGIYGAGLASIMSYLAILCINMAVSAKLFNTKYNYLYFLGGSFVLGSMAAVNFFISLSWKAFIIKFLLLMFTLIFFFRKLLKNNQLKNMWQRMRNKT
jgi:O-antigen/teichoic acid export membrane protein